MVARRKSCGENFLYNGNVPLKDGSVSQKNGTGKVRGDSLFLYFAVITGSLSFFSAGTSVVWTSPTLPKLSSNNTDINPLGYPLTSYDVSLIVGLFAIGNFVAPCFTGKLMDSLGRKSTLLIFGTLNTASFILLAYSKDLLWMLVARTVIGIAVGGVMIALPIYISEISDNHNRGKFGCLMGVFQPLGQLFGYSVGSLLSIKYFTLASALPVFLHTVLVLLFIPETPLYLLHNGRREEALKSLEKYRSNKTPSEIEKDLLTMEFTQQQSTKANKAGLLSIFFHEPARRGFIIAIGISLVQMGTGITILLSFMGPIFEEAQSGISGNVTAILSGSLKVTIFFLVSNIVERLGRKPLMLFSAFFCSTSLFLLGLYFFLKDHKFGSYQSLSWLPVPSLLFYMLSYSLGLGPIPITIVSELFPTHIRSTAMSSLIFLLSLLNVVVMASFPIVSQSIGISGCFWIFSAQCALGAVFIYIVIPETKGKSFDEIQDILRGNKRALQEIVE